MSTSTGSKNKRGFVGRLLLTAPSLLKSARHGYSLLIDEPSSSNADQSSPFLYLPREIRDQIYVYVLTSPSGYIYPNLEDFKTGLKLKTRLSEAMQNQSDISIFFGTGRYQTRNLSYLKTVKDWQRRCVFLCLLQSCSQIYKEARHLFYTLNIFVMPGLVRPKLQHRSWKQLRNVWIDTRYMPFYPGACEEVPVSKSVAAIEGCLKPWRCKDISLESLTIMMHYNILDLFYDTTKRELLDKLWEDLFDDGDWWRAEHKDSSEKLPGLGVEVRKKTRRREVTRRLKFWVSINDWWKYDGAIKQLGQAFGGELWLSFYHVRSLRVRDGVEVPEPVNIIHDGIDDIE